MLVESCKSWRIYFSLYHGRASLEKKYVTASHCFSEAINRRYV
uniref:Uncharacterized protein n=1 Tax=Anguilla anguilla TaxID=7936 RepID=A0A0E9U9Z1_ANGAN